MKPTKARFTRVTSYYYVSDENDIEHCVRVVEEHDSETGVTTVYCAQNPMGMSKTTTGLTIAQHLRSWYREHGKRAVVIQKTNNER